MNVTEIYYLKLTPHSSLLGLLTYESYSNQHLRQEDSLIREAPIYGCKDKNLKVDVYYFVYWGT